MTLFENTKPHTIAPEKNIKDLRVGDAVDGYFKLAALDKRNKRDGGTFLSLELMDRTGKIPAKVWNKADHYFNILKTGEICKVKGIVSEYMSQKEIKVDHIRLVPPSEEGIDRSRFEQQPDFDTRKLFQEMVDTLNANITSPHVQQLVDLFAREYGEKFSKHYGAQKIHHAYLGGLLEHTHSIIKLAVMCARHYSLDMDLLLAGALFHDLGKMYEFDIIPAVETTLEGGLLGHLIIGNAKFLELKSQIPGFPEELSCKIQHLIISHHGEKEFGSPEVPKIPEAYVLHSLDMLDSRLKIMSENLEKTETKGLFSQYINVLGRRLLADPKGGGREAQ